MESGGDNFKNSSPQPTPSHPPGAGSDSAPRPWAAGPARPSHGGPGQQLRPRPHWLPGHQHGPGDQIKIESRREESIKLK